MRREPQQHPNTDVRRERDPRAAKRQAILLATCALLALGFVFAASQKIAAVQYGYRNEELRRERERLLEEQRRLLLAIEESASLESLERTARELGMQPARASQMNPGEEMQTADATNALDEEEDTTKKRGRGTVESAKPRTARGASAETRRSP